MKPFLALFAFAALLLALPAAAQTASSIIPKAVDEPINAERPGFTNGVATVAPRRLQFEGGYTYSSTDNGYEHRFADAALLRVGTGNRTELRFGLPTYSFNHVGLIRAAGGTEDSSNGDTHGFTDTSVGTKWRFLNEGKHRPALALIAQTTLPTGEPAFRASHLQPQASLEAAYTISDSWGVQSDFVYTRASDSGQQYNQFAGGLNFGHDLGRCTGVFLETYRIAPTGAGQSNGNYVDGGITYILKNNTQFDFNFGAGISSSVRNDSFIGAGIAHRW